jgi:hypothetical protein
MTRHYGGEALSPGARMTAGLPYDGLTSFPERTRCPCRCYRAPRQRERSRTTAQGPRPRLPPPNGGSGSGSGTRGADPRAPVGRRARRPVCPAYAAASTSDAARRPGPGPKHPASPSRCFRFLTVGGEWPIGRFDVLCPICPTTSRPRSSSIGVSSSPPRKPAAAAAARGDDDAVNSAYLDVQRLTMALHRDDWMRDAGNGHALRMALREATKNSPGPST